MVGGSEMSQRGSTESRLIASKAEVVFSRFDTHMAGQRRRNGSLAGPRNDTRIEIIMNIFAFVSVGREP